MRHPIGKGLIFSTWWTFDLADVRIAEPDGFFQQGTHEGKFVGVRRPYNWSQGEYVVVLERAEAERDGDWYSLFIRPQDTESMTLIGSLRFKRRNPAIPATIRPDGISFLEVYSGAKTFDDIDTWRLAFHAFGDGEEASVIRSEYPAFPVAEVPNADAWIDLNTQRVHVEYGKGIARVHPPATLANRTLPTAVNEEQCRARSTWLLLAYVGTRLAMLIADAS